VAIWGLAGLRGYALGQEIAPNGQEYNQLFSLDWNFNLMLWSDQGLYAFAETRFWGQKAAPGVTNVHQGIFDFSKREFDFNLGAAWNYCDNFEARVFAYSLNNLNRGTSVVRPTGYNDGFGLENRYYLGCNYSDLGTDAFDTARASFLSVGYFPTKDMVDGNGQPFKPGPFVRAYVTVDLWTDWLYAYLDTQFIGRRSFTPELLYADAGLALRPFAAVPRLEFRLGSENNYDVRIHELETSLYAAVRFIY
jgi:hypothetical protein